MDYVFQFHNPIVHFGLKNGSVINTKQPKIDDVLEKIEICEGISVGTE